MFTTEQHLDNLIRHIRLVQENCLLLGKRLIEQGRVEFAHILIARGFKHDNSKFFGIEWEYLHRGPETPTEQLNQAILQHVKTNDHHPEFWGGITFMPEIAVAEMVCDWYARSQENATDLRAWIANTAMAKYKIDQLDPQRKWINDYLDILLQSSFVKRD